MFGWAKGSFTGAIAEYPGLLGQADGGTLFLDEIHHLRRELQAGLLGPLNDGSYRRKGDTQARQSDFDLVVATNHPQWRDSMNDDFRDRIERVVLEVPSFLTIQDQPNGINDIWLFWETTLRRRCLECGVVYSPLEEVSPCHRRLQTVMTERPLKGNWRDLQRLADHVLLRLSVVVS